MMGGGDPLCSRWNPYAIYEGMRTQRNFPYLPLVAARAYISLSLLTFFFYEYSMREGGCRRHEKKTAPTSICKTRGILDMQAADFRQFGPQLLMQKSGKNIHFTMLRKDVLLCWHKYLAPYKKNATRY